MLTGAVSDSRTLALFSLVHLSTKEKRASFLESETARVSTQVSYLLCKFKGKMTKEKRTSVLESETSERDRAS